MADAIHIKKSHEGELHQELHVPADKKIPLADLRRAAHAKSAAERSRAVFAINARHFNHR